MHVPSKQGKECLYGHPLAHKPDPFHIFTLKTAARETHQRTSLETAMVITFPPEVIEIIFDFMISEPALSPTQLSILNQVCRAGRKKCIEHVKHQNSKVWVLPENVKINQEGLWAFERELGESGHFIFNINHVDPGLGSDRKLMLGLCWEDAGKREYITISGQGNVYLHGIIVHHLSVGQQLQSGDSINFFFERSLGGSLKVAINQTAEKSISGKRLHSRSRFQFGRVWAIAYVYTKDYSFEPSSCAIQCIIK